MGSIILFLIAVCCLKFNLCLGVGDRLTEHLTSGDNPDLFETEATAPKKVHHSSSKIIEKQTEILSPGIMQFSWEVDNQEETVTFEVVAKTKGYVGFGLNFNGGMEGADMVMGGVFSNGQTYFDDFHGVGNTMPVRDPEQNWILLEGSENETHTTLKFLRAFDTCDSLDVPITNDTINVIWAIGDQDMIKYHFASRGTLPVNLLDDAYPTLNLSEYSKWDMINTMEMPSKRFVYWCKIYRAPKFNGKSHIVGFKPMLYGPLAVQHTHHFVLYKCTPPPGVDDKTMFDRFADTDGEECYVTQAQKTQPTGFCSVSLYIWGAGGKPLYLPKHVGYPAGISPQEYFMLEVHYDNPAQASGIQFKTGVQMIYTNKLREHNAALMTIGHATLMSIFIPPMTKNWQVKGHCAEDCTSKFIPPKGIKMFNAMLHTHLAGRKMRLRHFRNNTELPWIANDDHYQFNYQKNRPIRDERLVLPGDHITFECTYDTLDRNTITIGGFSTTHEMCETFVWYYPAQNIKSCTSYIPTQLVFQRFGIAGGVWGEGFEGNDPVITGPENMANKTFTEVANTMTKWTQPFINDLSNMLKSAPQITSCDMFAPSQTSDSETSTTTDTEEPEETTVISAADTEATSSNKPVEKEANSNIDPTPTPLVITNTPTVKQIYRPPSKCPAVGSGNDQAEFRGTDHMQNHIIESNKESLPSTNPGENSNSVKILSSIWLAPITLLILSFTFCQ